jgi:hypothetical protein
MKDKNVFFIDIEMQQRVRNSLNCVEVPPWEDRMDVHSKDFPEIWKFRQGILNSVVAFSKTS